MICIVTSGDIKRRIRGAYDVTLYAWSTLKKRTSATWIEYINSYMQNDN